MDFGGVEAVDFCRNKIQAVTGRVLSIVPDTLDTSFKDAMVDVEAKKES